MSISRVKTMQGSGPAGGQSLADTVLLLLTLCTLTGPHHAHAGVTPRFVEEPDSAILWHHHPVTLRCRVEPATAHVQWLLNRKPLDFREHRDIQLQDNHDLHFPLSAHGALDVGIEGEYRCLATSQNVTVVSRPATLSRPVLRKFPPSDNLEISAPEGGFATIPCIAPESQPPAQIDILTETGSLLGHTRGDGVERLPSGSVILRNLKVQDSGVYRCLAVNQVSGANRTASHNITLRVTSPPGDLEQTTVIVDQSFPTLHVSSGDSVLLECPTAGAGKPNVTWAKYGGDLPSKRTEVEFGNLRIHAVNVLDKGTYICETINGKTRKLSLEVNTPPVIVAMPDDSGLRVETGETVKITCTGAGFPSPTVMWFHNGAVIGRRKVHSRGSDHILILENVQVENSGIYTCDLANVLGHVSAQVHLIVAETKDYLSAGSDNGLTTADGRSTDSPAGEVLDILDDLVGGEETKADVPNEDSTSRRPATRRQNDRRTRKRKNKRRKYKKNRGNTEKVILVPPSPPSVSRLSDTSVMVNWSVPENDGLPITFFRVQYKEVKPNKGPWQTLDRDIDAKARRYEVSRLRAGGTYKFRIAAVYSNNDNKIGPNSKHFHLALLTNPELHPPKVKPKVVEAKPITYQNIYAIGIKWQYLPVDPSPIEGFHIFYKPFDSAEDFENITLIGAGIRNHLLTDLKPDTEYTIKMQCFNTAGVSDFSNTVVKRTLPTEGQPPESLPTPPIPPEKPADEGPETTSRRETVNMDHPVILGSVLGFMLLLLVVFIVMCLWKQRQQKRRNLSSECSKFQDQAQRIYTDSLRKKYPNGQYPLNGLNGLVLANGHGPHSHHKMNIDINPLSEMDSHPSHMSIPHSVHSSKAYHQGNGIPNGTIPGFGHSPSSDNNFNNIRQTVSVDNVHGYSGLVPNGVGVRSLPRNGNTPGRHTTRRHPISYQSKPISALGSNSYPRPRAGSGSCSPSDTEYSLDEEDQMKADNLETYLSSQVTGHCQGQGYSGKDSLEGLSSCERTTCDGFEGFGPVQCEIVSEFPIEGSGFRHWEPQISSSPSSSHSSKHKRRRRRPQSGREHSTKDQATNTDLSSNEGTIEFTMFNKSPSSSVSNSSDDKAMSSHDSQCLGIVTLPTTSLQTAVPL